MTEQGSGETDCEAGVQAIKMAERRLRGGLKAVVATVIQRAQAGDMAAARIVLDRLLPAPRDQRISFALRPIACSEDAIKASADVLAAMAQGQITLAEGDLVSNYCAISARRASCASSSAGWRRSRRTPRHADARARKALQSLRSARAHRG